MHPLWRPVRQVLPALTLVCPFLFSPLLEGRVLGTNPPAAALDQTRIGGLPPGDRACWLAYLQRSEEAKQADKAFLRAELAALGRTEPAPAPHGRNAGLPLDKAASWYGQAEAIRIADIVLSYQLPSGTWGKNIDMTLAPRPPGGHFTADNQNPHPSVADNDQPPQDGWSYLGTFDNDATTSQLRFLARVASASGSGEGTRHREGFLRGFRRVLDTQYPNGGYPQVWPLMGGYHDAVTFNDGVMTNILRLLRDVAEGRPDFAWVPAPLRERAGAALSKAVRCVLACQVRTGGLSGGWCQQHDALTLAPCSARNYEMPSLCAPESADIALFLMELNAPSPELCDALAAVSDLFEKTAVRGKVFKDSHTGRHLEAGPAGSVLWARYYDLSTGQPVFGDRDKSIHDDLEEISRERRDGYKWYSDTPARMLQRYAAWRTRH